MELKECPFCGGAPELDKQQAYRPLSGSYCGKRAAIYCLDCSADVGMCWEDMPEATLDQLVNFVVEQWNQRHIVTLPDKGE